MSCAAPISLPIHVIQVAPDEFRLFTAKGRRFGHVDTKEIADWLCEQLNGPSDDELSRIAAKVEEIRSCESGMCSHCIDILCEDVIPMIASARTPEVVPTGGALG